MSFTKDEALTKIGKRVQIHGAADDDLRAYFSKDVPTGTTGQVIHANLYHRFTHSEYDPIDFYHVVIEWDALDRRIDMFDDSDYKLFITELE
jgi:hypothetical protein